MKSPSGFSIIELLVVMSIFVTSILAIFGVSQFIVRAVGKAADRTQVAFLLEEGTEAVKYIRDASWKRYIQPRPLGEKHCLDFSLDKKKFFLTNPKDNKLLLRLNESSGATVFADESGLNNNATCVVASCPQSYSPAASSDHAAAVQLAPSKFLTLNHPAFDFGGTQPMTFLVWIYINNSATQKEFFSKYDGTKGYRLAILANEQLEFFLKSAGGGLVAQTFLPISDSLWKHVAVTYNGSSFANGVLMYVDGELVAQANAPQDNLGSGDIHNTQALTIGRASNNTPNTYFNGPIDEVMIFGRVLSGAEIRDIFNVGSICKKVDNKFSRNVTFQNACRSAEKDILGSTTNETGSCMSGGTTDAGTKQAVVEVTWRYSNDSPPVDFIESIEMYLTNIFREP